MTSDTGSVGGAPFERYLAVGPGFDGTRFDPRPVVGAVNALVGLGAEGALAAAERALGERRRLGAGASDNLLLVSRLAFVPRDADGLPPRLRLGSPDLTEPSDPGVFPLFPLHLAEDLPLLLIGGYTLAGQSEDPGGYLRWCRQEATVRSRLAPPPDPWRVVDDLLGSPWWESLQPEPWHARMLRLQAWRAVSDVIALSPEDEERMSGDQSADATWKHRVQDRADGALVWDSETSSYRRP